MRKIILFITLLLSLAVVNMFYSKSTTPPANSNPFTPPSKMLPKTPKGGEKSEKRPNTDRPITRMDIKKLHQYLPDEQQVNEELKSNPHTPSKTLMAFAKQLGPLMEKAFENKKDAHLLVKELSLCAHDESLADAARATCVTNTERLGEVYPSIKEEAKELRISVSEEVKDILETNDAFVRQ